MNVRVSYVCLVLFRFVDRYVCFGIKDVMLYVRCMLVCVCEFRMQVLKSFF